jgi:hypothetical protein
MWQLNKNFGIEKAIPLKFTEVMKLFRNQTKVD